MCPTLFSYVSLCGQKLIRNIKIEVSTVLNWQIKLWLYPTAKIGKKLAAPGPNNTHS